MVHYIVQNIVHYMVHCTVHYIVHSSSVRPSADQVAPSCRACTTRLESDERGASQRTDPLDTKEAATGCWPATTPKPHCSLSPVGAKLSPSSEITRGFVDATSTNCGESERSSGGRSGSEVRSKW